MSIPEDMPMLTRHEGVWDGYYRYYNYDGEKTDEHRSRLICQLPTPNEYRQLNIYRWKDGKSEERSFPTRVEGKRLIFYTLIDGWSATVDLDEHDRTTMLYWVRKAEPDLYLYEMIQLSDCNQFRSRTWQWFRDGKLVQRTLIDEKRVANNWQDYLDIKVDYDDLCKGY